MYADLWTCSYVLDYVRVFDYVGVYYTQAEVLLTPGGSLRGVRVYLGPVYM